MTPNDYTIWQQVVGTNQAAVAVSDTFFRKAEDRVGLLRQGLHGSVIEILTSLGLLSRLPIPEQMQLFETLLPLCLSPKFSQGARSVVLALPHAWVLAHIEEAAEPLLRTADNRDYLMLLGLFEPLDHSLAIRLAHKASLSDDFDIKEVGDDFLSSHETSGPKD